MIRFFRKIRQRLLSENRFSKYLLYALGEIFLVVIGILIALQINNWNEARKARKIEQKYLVALKSEFNNNLKEVNRVIALCDSVFIASKALINKTDAYGKPLSTSGLTLASMKALRFPPKFTQSPGILNDLLSSGYLSKLNNIELRSHIQNWFTIVQEVSDEEEEFWAHREKLIDLMQKEISFRTMMIDLDEKILGPLTPKPTAMDNSTLYYDDYYDNLILFYSIVVRSLQLEFYPGLKQNIESILQEIEISLEET